MTIVTDRLGLVRLGLGIVWLGSPTRYTCPSMVIGVVNEG
jgi:hypothetical protein